MNLNFFKKHSTLVVIISVTVLIAAGITARAIKKNNTDGSNANPKPLIKLLKVSDYSQSSHTVSANGTVESLQQVDLKSQAGGKITRIDVKVGDHVSFGQILAVIDQSGAGAALTSAKGALAQAQASYNKLLAGASDEQIRTAQVNVDNAATALENTKAAQDTAIRNAYNALLNTSIAPIATSGNMDNVSPVISGTYNGGQEGTYTISIYSTGSGLKFNASGLENATGDVKNQPVPFGAKGLYIQFNSTPSPSDTWTITIPNTYSPSYLPTFNAYQNALKARDAAIAGAQGQLDSAKAALSQLQAQARPADIQAAQAQILIAQGQVQAAEAAYANTLIKAPFSGTVSALSIKYADLVSPGQKIASIVNQEGLQIKVFVTGDDLSYLKPNAIAQIGSSKATGTVTNIAPSVDAVTRTAEVDIAVADPSNSGLTVGQNVPITIAGEGTSTQSDIFLLPIQAVKLTQDGKAFVYKMDSGNKAQEVPVTAGKVNGEMVEVTGDISKDTEIISNAYDVSSGDTVQLQ